MEQNIRQRLQREHVEEIAGRYGTTPEQLRPLDGYESFIFSVAPLELVIRVGHSSRRPPELVEGELDWMSYLASRGVSVAELVALTRARRLLGICVPNAHSHRLESPQPGIPRL